MMPMSMTMMPSSRRRIIRGRQVRIQPWNRNGEGIGIFMIHFFSNLGVGVIVTLLLFVSHHGHSFQIITNHDSSSSYYYYGIGRAGGKVPRPNYAVFMTTTDTETLSSHSHDFDTNFNNGDCSSSSSDNISNTNIPSFPIKNAASDIIDLVNDAAASATALSSSASSSEVGAIDQQIETSSNDEILADYKNGDDYNTIINVDEIPLPSSSSSAKEVALDILALENDAAASAAAAATSVASSFGAGDGNTTGGGGGSNNGGLPFAPMMTYQKYLTMQEKRVKVTIRYSAEAGLRPFYLTVADQIKSAHPDVLLEKRILPRVAGGGGADEAVFEVIVDGRTIIGKKKTRMLKVSPSSISSSSRGGGSKSSLSSSSGSGEEDDDDIVNVVGGGNIISEEREDNRRGNTPDIAGGRTVFIGMERLAAELAKARKKRRPNTTYRTESLREESDVIGGAGINTMTASNNSAQSSKMTEAVIRLERLKAMGGARNKV